ncbi:MAG: fructosamine kinase family protein, partial [Anaerolineae bacterium]|nr:fructosamine kinase family protein [Anaerolineae bacterium]
RRAAENHSRKRQLMSLPVGVQQALEAFLKTSVVRSQWMGGGDINEAARVDTASETFFVKWNPNSPPGMFTAEAQGLRLLESAGSLKVPRIILASEQPAFLALEWLPIERPQQAALLAERLGEGVAALHQKTQDRHGLDHDNYIGRLHQFNTPMQNWPEFYRDQRIRVQMEIARQKGQLTPERERILDKLCQKLPQLLPNIPPSLLHGDLWDGNYAGIPEDIPVIYDPAVYYGHREVEIAFTELFGGFAGRFYEAYNAVFPLDKGYPERKALYQLYPLLVHLNLFGGSYGSSVDSIAHRYA